MLVQGFHCDDSGSFHEWVIELTWSRIEGTNMLGWPFLLYPSLLGVSVPLPACWVSISAGLASNHCDYGGSEIDKVRVEGPAYLS